MIHVLMALAVTLPPSAAFVACFWLSRDREKAIELNKAAADVLSSLGDKALHLEQRADGMRAELDQHTLNLSQLNERL